METKIISLLDLGFLVVFTLIVHFIFLKITKAINYEYGKKYRYISVICSVILSVLPLLVAGKIYSILLPVYYLLSIFIVILTEITFIDFKYYEISNRYNLFLATIGFLTASYFQLVIIDNFKISGDFILASIAMGVITFIVFFILAIFSGGNLGMGDVKMSFGLGTYASIITFINLASNTNDFMSLLKIGGSVLAKLTMYGFFSGAIVSIILLLFKIKKPDDKIAFAPYLVLGFLIYIFLNNMSYFALI